MRIRVTDWEVRVYIFWKFRTAIELWINTYAKNIPNVRDIRPTTQVFISGSYLILRLAGAE